jgi:RimJ/RimL family protein N-acetyltransferase
MIRIREISPVDAGNLLELMQELDYEADYLLYEPGERPVEESAMREHIRKLDPPEFGTFFAAESLAAEAGDVVATAPEPEPGETGTTADAEAPSSGSTGEMAGYLEIRRLPWRRVRHRAYLVIGILKRFGGQGVGTRLMQEAESWARRHGVRRLYLTLVAENTAAVALYRKMGYEIEGRHPASMKLGDRFVEELTMGKWLD